MGFLKATLRDPWAAGGLLFPLLVAAAAALSLVVPGLASRAFETSAMDQLASPSVAHWLGADRYGRDVLARLVLATRFYIFISLVAMGVGLAVGAALAALARWRGSSVPPGPLLRFLAIGPILSHVLVLVTPFSWRVVLLPLFGSAQGALIAYLILVLLVPLAAMGYRLFRQRPFSSGAVVGLLLLGWTTTLVVVPLLEGPISYLGLGRPEPQPSWGASLTFNLSDITGSARWPIFAAAMPSLIATLSAVALSVAIWHFWQRLDEEFERPRPGEV